MDAKDVIEGLEPILGCAKQEKWGAWIESLEKAISLLKEQPEIEPKQVRLYGKEEWYGLVCVCPDCDAEWMCAYEDTHFCPNCGIKVKWNG